MAWLGFVRQKTLLEMWSNSFMPASVGDGDEKNIVIPNEFHTPLPRKRHQNSDCVLFPRSNKKEKSGELHVGEGGEAHHPKGVFQPAPISWGEGPLAGRSVGEGRYETGGKGVRIILPNQDACNNIKKEFFESEQKHFCGNLPNRNKKLFAQVYSCSLNGVSSKSCWVTCVCVFE